MNLQRAEVAKGCAVSVRLFFPVAGLLWSFVSAAAQEGTEPLAPPVARQHYIREYRILGAKELDPAEAQAAVYPFLGPGRTEQDFEAARSALEQAYYEKGFQAASVQVLPHVRRGGVVYLSVSEGRVGKLRVKGSRYFLPSQLKERARSLAEGQALNFNNITSELVRLNQQPDRVVTLGATRPGVEPGTVDVDLTVQDTLPLHASLELNNRYSPDTTPLRLNGSFSYNNLWGAGHTLGGSFQIAPQNLRDAEIFSGYYIWRFPGAEWFSLSLQGSKQNSDVAALGSRASLGRTDVIGFRAIFTFPSTETFSHSFNFGLDYKHIEQVTTLFELDGLDLEVELVQSAPISYYPISLNYSAVWAPKSSLTELNLGLVFGVRGFGDRSQLFENKRFRADGNYLYLRGDLSHEQTLPHDFQLFGKVQGQVSNRPLVDAEQFTGGGLATARGYLESETAGDNAVFGTLELRSPTLLSWLPGKGHEWRVYLFGDAGVLTLRNPLPEQISSFQLASYGIGTRIQLYEYLNGSLDLAIPLISEGTTQAHDPFLSFRVWAEF